MIGVTVGHYRITSKLGAGGMGEVFLAEDTRLERKATIKFLPSELASDAERRQRFLREGKVASALNHPNVCVVDDVGETDDGLPFIAMEFVEGESLDASLKRGPMEVAKVVQIATQVRHEPRQTFVGVLPELVLIFLNSDVDVQDTSSLPATHDTMDGAA